MTLLLIVVSVGERNIQRSKLLQKIASERHKIRHWMASRVGEHFCPDVGVCYWRAYTHIGITQIVASFWLFNLPPFFCASLFLSNPTELSVELRAGISRILSSILGGASYVLLLHRGVIRHFRWALPLNGAWRSVVVKALRCATSRTVSGSIPVGVTGFFSDIFPPDQTMALGSTQPLVKMSTRNVPGGKGGRCVKLTTYHHTVLPTWMSYIK